MKKNYLLLAIFAITTITTFSQSTLTNGLKAHYLFENNLIDSSGNSNHLVGNNNEQYNSISQYNHSIFFDGNTRISSNNPFNNSQYTQTAVSLWFKTTGNANAMQIMIQGAYMGFGIYLDNYGKVMGFYNPPAANALRSNKSLNDGKWHHVLTQNDGTTTYLYIDGELNSSKPEYMNVGDGSSNNRLYFGKSNLNMYSYNGDLDDVKIYDRILTAREIKTISNCIRLDEGLKADFKFDNTINDSSGNQEDLTSNNPPSYVSFNGIDSAIYLDGTDQLVSAQPFDNSNYNETAISLWFKSTHSGNIQTILQGAFMGFGVYMDGNGRVRNFFNPPAANSLMSSQSFNDGAWHHVVSQNNGDTTYLYIDGIFDGSKPETMNPGNAGSNNKLYVGLTNLNMNAFTGAVNNVKIYDRTLTQCEIDSLSSTGPNVSTSIVKSNVKRTQVNVYPNPFTNTFNVELNNSFKNARLNVKNILGQVVFTSKVINSGVQQVTVNEENGIYFLELIKENGEVSIAKMIKN